MYKDKEPRRTNHNSSFHRPKYWAIGIQLGEDHFVAVWCTCFGAACSLVFYKTREEIAVMYHPPVQMPPKCNGSRFHVICTRTGPSKRKMPW
ncbi:hypothetical protein ACOSQ2_019533 [Xanthoceras sorbifolium]